MIIICGEKNQGKTTQIKRFVKFLKENKQSVAGVYSEKVFYNNSVVGYDIVTITNNEKFKFLRNFGNDQQQRIGPFYMDQFALAEGVIQIKQAIIHQANYLIIDEVGKLELNNKGWCVALELAITQFKGELILAVRTEFVTEVIKKWQLNEVQIIGTSEVEFDAYTSIKK